MDESDAELVHQIRRGSRQAADTLARRYLRGSRAIALALTGDGDMADDVCQDSFVYAMEHLDQCRHPERFGAWLGRIVRSHAYNHLRDQKPDRRRPLADAAGQAVAESPSREADRSLLRDRLLEALATLSVERRQVVLLHDLEGWTHREIAERMELPAGTVRSHLHHARLALRRLLTGQEAE
jgi:RNA polymerase sigma-70 factor (ECF subfamily)